MSSCGSVVRTMNLHLAGSGLISAVTYVSH